MDRQTVLSKEVTETKGHVCFWHLYYFLLNVVHKKILTIHPSIFFSHSCLHEGSCCISPGIIVREAGDALESPQSHIKTNHSHS